MEIRGDRVCFPEEADDEESPQPMDSKRPLVRTSDINLY